MRDVGIAWRGRIGADSGGFTQFEHLGWGIRALALDLMNDMSEGKNTISKLIQEFAPPSENDTGAYVQAMANYTGFGANQALQINNPTLAKLIRGIVIVENGAQPAQLITDADIQEGLRMAGDTSASVPLLTGGAIVAATLLGISIYLLATMPPMPKPKF